MTITLAGLRRYSPLGPIFGKELRSTARRKRTYVLRFVYLAILFSIMLFFFVVSGLNMRGQHSSAVRQSQQLAEMGAVFFGIFAFFTVSSMALIGPVLTATAVNSERLHKTLAVLLMTPITAWQIVSGKLFSRLLIALTLIGLTLPALSVVRLLGGVETDQIIGILGLSVAIVIFGAAIGLFLSTLMNRAYSVILLSYGTMLSLYALLPAGLGIIISTIFRNSAPTGMPAGLMLFYRFMNFTNPFFMTAVIVVPGAPFKASSWIYCASFHLIAAAALLLLSSLVLRRMAKKENDGGSPPAPAPSFPGGFPVAISDRSSPLPVAAPLSHHVQPATYSRKRPAPVSDNPVLWRELRRPLVARRWQAILLSLFLVGTLLFFYICMAVNDELSEQDWQMPFACIFCGLLTLVTCVVSATAIAQEKESDTWTLLLSTPLSPRQIVLGKFAGLLRRFMWPSILICLHFLFFGLGGVLNWTTVAIILFLIFSTNLIWVATGLYLSLRLKTVTLAVILNLCGPTALYGFAVVVLGIIGGVFYHSDTGFEIVGLYSPYAYLCSAIDMLNRSNPTHVWIPVFRHVSVGDFYAIVSCLGLAYLLLTCLVLWHAIRSFNRIVGRARQVHSPSFATPSPIA